MKTVKMGRIILLTGMAILALVAIIELFRGELFIASITGVLFIIGLVAYLAARKATD